MMTVMNRGYFFLSITAVLVLPLYASAHVVITHVMYDPPGADSGHEYIELLNAGTSSVRLTDYTLRTNGTKHKIVALSGDGTLGIQAHAMITQDAGLFAADVPNFDGTVFHSAFSLTNTRGTVEIVDKSGAVIAATSYTAPPPAPKTQKTHSVKKTKNKVPTSVHDNTDSSIDTVDTTMRVEQAAATEVAAASTPSSLGSSVWLMGAVVLAGAAGVATFYARRTAKREWDIVEEDEESSV